MKMKSVAVLVLTLGVVASAGAESGRADESYFSFMADYLARPDEKHNPPLANSFGFDFRYGVRLDERWSFEGRAFYGRLESKSAQATGYRSGAAGDAVYRLPPLWKITPILLAGGGVVVADFMGGQGAAEGGGMVNLGAGLLTAPLVNLFGWPIYARFEVRESYEHYKAEYYDLRAHFGLEIALRDPEPPPATPEPVRVVAPVPAVADADGDGVPDDRDRCPGSPDGKPVDLDGCAPPPRVITLEGVKFDVNSDVLTADSLPVLDAAAAVLSAEAPDVHVEVAGHTDDTGDDAYNLDLSRRRAVVVRDYLVGKGVVAERLSAAGYGEGEPVADNTTDEGRRQNRRVELRVKSN